MLKCFVIQPFDGTIYESRYNEIFKPAIIKAGLKPYRVDQDPHSKIPIQSIEEEIKNAAICFAEITTNNPNVWYELGFAYACKKDVVMICSDERIGEFPFDIRHRTIIPYKSNTTGDFKKLKIAITERLKALIEPYSIKIIRQIADKDWLAKTNRSNPQGTDFQELLRNHFLKSIHCKIKTSSDYFRFGFKLSKMNGKLFGDSIIKSNDSNLILHIGKDINSPNIFMSSQLNGNEEIPIQPLFKYKADEWIDLKFIISKDNISKFYVNDVLEYDKAISPEMTKKIYMLAWADSHEFKINVNDIIVESAEE